MNFSLEPERINTPGIHKNISITDVEFATKNIQGADYRHIDVHFKTNDGSEKIYTISTSSMLYGEKLSIDDVLATDATGNFTCTVVKFGTKVTVPALGVLKILHQIFVALNPPVPSNAPSEALLLIQSAKNADDLVAKLKVYIKAHSAKRVQLKLVNSYQRGSDGKVQKWAKEDQKQTFVFAESDTNVPPFNEKTDWIGKQDCYLEFHDPTLAVKQAISQNNGTPPGAVYTPPGASFIPLADDLPFETIN